MSIPLLTFLSFNDIIYLKGGLSVNTIGDRIKYVRKEILKNKSQKDFGHMIGLKANSVSCIETGTNNPTEQTIKAICREFSINETWLRTGEGNSEKDKDIDFGNICADIGINDSKAREAIEKYYELSPEDKELWWKFIERFMNT